MTSLGDKRCISGGITVRNTHSKCNLRVIIRCIADEQSVVRLVLALLCRTGLTGYRQTVRSVKGRSIGRAECRMGSVLHHAFRVDCIPELLRELKGVVDICTVVLEHTARRVCDRLYKCQIIAGARCSQSYSHIAPRPAVVYRCVDCPMAERAASLSDTCGVVSGTSRPVGIQSIHLRILLQLLNALLIGIITVHCTEPVTDCIKEIVTRIPDRRLQRLHPVSVRYSSNDRLLVERRCVQIYRYS